MPMIRAISAIPSHLAAAIFVAMTGIVACLGCGEEADKKPAANEDTSGETQTGLDVDFGKSGSDVTATTGDSGSASDTALAKDTATATDTKSATATDTAVTDTASATDTGAATATDTGSSTATDTGVATDTATATDTGPPPDIPPSKHIKRVVLAGDSWSTGLIKPLRDAMDARGFKAVQLSHAFTANAGSQAEGWVKNQHPPKAGGGVDTTKPKMLDALKESLDNPPVAELLVLVIGGNDYNRECDSGYGKSGSVLQKLAMDKIQKDVGDLVDEAIAKRPHLNVVIVGYDFFHFDFLKAFGLKLPGHTLKSYNEGLVELDKRRLAVAAKRTNVHFANNLGILQHTYGDKIHPPYPIPNPLTGHPPYKPGVAPKPGWAPKYNPMPGGFITYPAPLDHMPDGIHPTPKAFRTIIDHTLDQGMEALLLKGKWPK